MKEKVSSFVGNILKDHEDLFLIEVIMKGKEPRQKVMVILDGDNGVTIDQCASVSRQLGKILEEEQLINSAYHLEVSSAGLDSPLSQLRQYKKNIGRGLKVTLDDETVITGILVSVDDEGLVLEIKKGKKEEPEQFRIEFKAIKKSFVTVSFK